jgi:hypothetical protein
MSSRRPCGTFDTSYKKDLCIMRTSFHRIMFALLMIAFLVFFPLAALGSYALVNLFLGFTFNRQYRNLLRRKIKKRVGPLEKTLVEVWSD